MHTRPISKKALNTEDCLEIVAGISELKYSSVKELSKIQNFTLHEDNANIMFSIAKQVFRGTALTAKQYALVKKLLVEYYTDQFDAHEIDLKEAVEKAKFQIISELHNDLSLKKADVEIVRNVKKGSIVIDIRHPNEQEVNPLALNCKSAIINIPFYSLSSKFERLAKNQNYLLYCDKGMMSRLHAANLIEQGFSNVSVLDLKAAE